MTAQRDLAGALLGLLLAGAACAETRLDSGYIAADTPWKTAYYVRDSGVDGPTLLITGGVHGNEPAGARAAEQIRHWPIVRGRLIVVPQTNIAGLKANTRFLPGRPAERRDLNRNFPDVEADGEETDKPRGQLAAALWRFVQEQKPQWVVDLHEGYEFNISHKPPNGKQKSVGSSIIYQQGPALDGVAERMLAAANAGVTDPERRFVLLKRGPKRTTFVSACTHHLGLHGMILETTFSRQPLSTRTAQHRAMVNVLLREIGMIDRDCRDVMRPERRPGRVAVGLFDGAGTGGDGVKRLTSLLDAAPNTTVDHVGPRQLRPATLRQFDVVIFPGGSGQKQANAIGQAGRRTVRDFVQQGGGYLGVCAGSYLCSAHYKWSLKLIDTSVFTGAREIEGVGKKQMWYRGKSTQVKMQLTREGQRIFGDVPELVNVRYHNGPIVSRRNDPDLLPFTPLAYFRSEQTLYPPQEGTMVDSPAIVGATFGQGRVISISPHPESTPGLTSMVTAAVRWVAGREAAAQQQPNKKPLKKKPQPALAK